MSRVVAEARLWLGTPYLHQGSRQGAGADCLGLIRGIWRALYGAEPELPPPYTPDWGEAMRHEALAEAAARHLVPAKGAMTAGEVLLFRMRAGAVAKHLGILTEAGRTPRFIHAYDRHGVVESPLSAPWRMRIAGRFRFPGH